ncbi:hypothetical protein [Streptomyces sp. 8N706]|uniref:hypothetical protein n=1 Tax=Streptomyces sp. 8N706 TaxID=3457416 RepID=UPI003FD6299F
MAPALRTRLAIGFLVGAALLPAPAALALDRASVPTEGWAPVARPPHAQTVGRLGGLVHGSRPMADPEDPPVGPAAPRSGSADERGRDQQADPGTPWAGRRAGEGRVRPGRAPGTADRPGFPPGVPGWAHALDPSAPADGSARPDRPGRPLSPPPRPSVSPTPTPTHQGVLRPPASHAWSPAPTARDGLEAVRPRPPLPYEPSPPGDSVTAPSAATTGSDPGTSGDSPDQAVGRPTGRMLRVLPLGTGLALMGIGLAFIGFRLRQR